MPASWADRNSTEQEYSTLYVQEAQTAQKFVTCTESHMKDMYLLFPVISEAATGAPGWKPQTELSEEMKGLSVSQFLVNENQQVSYRLQQVNGRMAEVKEQEELWG